MKLLRDVRKALAVIVVTLLAAHGAYAADTPTHGGTLRLGVVQDVSTFDPHVYTGVVYNQVQMNVYDNLLGYDASGNLIPQLALSWHTDDSVTWTLDLRRGVEFSNGNPFTAEDVVYTFERIADPATSAYMEVTVREVSEVEAVDDFTVRFVLEGPNASFADTLARSGFSIVDKEFAEAGGDFATEMVGTGPFLLSSFERGVKYDFVRNPNYWEDGKPYLDAFTLVFIENATTRVAALRSGEVDLADFVPWTEMATIESSPDLELVKALSTVMLVRLNPNREPFDNKLVRQALNYAIDRELLNALAWGGLGEPMRAGLIPEGTDFFSEDLAIWNYDPQKAVELLAEAGYRPSDIHLTLESMDWVGHSDSATIILEQLTSLGIDIQLQINPIPVVTQQRATGEYQMLIDGLRPRSSEPGQYYTDYFHSNLGSQHAVGAGFGVPELDQILDRMRAEPDRDVRIELAHQAEALILEEAPWIFLQFRPDGEAIQSSVKGYIGFPGVLSTFNQAYLENVWLDK